LDCFCQARRDPVVEEFDPAATVMIWVALPTSTSTPIPKLGAGEGRGAGAGVEAGLGADCGAVLGAGRLVVGDTAMVDGGVESAGLRTEGLRVIGTLLLMATVLLGEAVLLAVTVRLVGALRVVAVGGRADEADAEVVGGTSGRAIEAVAACVVDRGSVSTEGVALVCAALAAGSAFERGLGRLVVELVAMVRTGRAERVTAATAALLGAAVGALDRVRAGTEIGGADAVDGSASVDGSARVVDAAGVEEGATWAALAGCDR